MRVMIESFEKWYANQLHYKKVNGELPGAELLQRTMTIPTMANLLGIREATAYELIHRLHFRSVKTEYSSQRLLIDKATFYEWLKSQTHYKIVEGKEDFYDREEWELMTKNPCVNATLPQEEHKARDIWDAPTLFKALELCDDDILRLAINLAFSCSLRVGEMLGLTWDCVEISAASIANGTAFIFVNKELQRVNRDALEKLNEKGIILKFPAFFARTNTALVLKEPKTKTSTRKVFLPKTVAEMLKERYQEIQEYKELFGDEFQDFNLVFCNANGRPMESQIITRALQKLIKDNDLPPVVFHSLRHSSITYKLKLNGGDIKSVQGDSGHAQVKMVTDVYSHIIDEDRRLNAQRFEETFYQKKNPSEVNGATVEPKKEPQGITEEAMLNYMVQNPDFLQKFKVLLGVGN